VRALHALEGLARQRCPRAEHREVGRLVHLGAGLGRDAFAAELTVAPDPERISAVYVVQLPRADAEDGSDRRVRREMAALGTLASASLPFRVPRVLGAWPDRYGTALARTFVPGIPLDLRAGRRPSVCPWAVVGEIAAAIHAIEMGTLGGSPNPPATLRSRRSRLPPHAIDAAALPPAPADPRTRQDHGRAALAELATLDVPEARDALAWATEHLPPPEPARLLHGDLLGQNILRDPGGDPPYGVIDWEYTALGDPAYDLAIVTRCARQPFQIPDGAQRLLEAYHGSGGSPTVSLDHVRLHELALAAGWYRAALADPDRGAHRMTESIHALRRVLRAATTPGHG
jgi:Ser/Thr protein kinase RdoA (MazF antagonist)